ncbi:MAG: hypothetical protein MUC58_02495 [Rhizobiaceae bacterium]|jgi:hypothetical protein|nr:hypothetical protein [Rhizobiaceae bacterium]
MNTQNILRSVARRSLASRVLAALDRVEYRRVRSGEDLDAVIALRRKAYGARGIYARADQPMTDAFDLDPRVYVFAVHVDGQMLATLRVHIITAENPVSNSVTYFKRTLQPLIDQGLSFMDPTRFAVDPDMRASHPGLPLVTLRLGFVAAKHFRTDFCLSMIKEQHEPFYRTVFRSTQIAPYTQFDTFQSRYALFSSPASMEDAICAEFPIFRSTQTERALLFDAPQADAPPVISVRPTAAIAIRQRAALASSLGEAL